MAIWKKPRSGEPDRKSAPRAVPVGETAPSKATNPQAVFRIGESIRLKGELAASTDVEIRGQVDGTVRLEGYRLEVAENAQVIAEVFARSVRVAGQVVGNVTATEQILIDSGGSVLGDLCAPSIQLEDGSHFTGGINKQAAPAKVTGRLSGETASRSPQSDIETSAKRARHQGLFDQNGKSA